MALTNPCPLAWQTNCRQGAGGDSTKRTTFIFGERAGGREGHRVHTIARAETPAGFAPEPARPGREARKKQVAN